MAGLKTGGREGEVGGGEREGGERERGRERGREGGGGRTN